MYVFSNLNQTLIGMSKVIIAEGVWRETRGFRCLEIPNPVLICIENPTDRYINIPERKWNKQLGFAESLWLASGTNHMKLVGDYVKNMYSFSDDGEFMRAGYGPRIRSYSGLATDYTIEHPNERNIVSGFIKTVDQLKFVVDSLTRDINSRQAEITIHDPVKDDYDENNVLKVTKDTPCCRSVNFMVVDGKLNCTLDIRSNDLVWGLSAVNVFNFTLMQEYIANMLGIPVGKYYHFVKNLHIYEDKFETVKGFSELNPEDYASEFGVWSYYGPEFAKLSFKEFDDEITNLFNYEREMRAYGYSLVKIERFRSTIIKDWARVFYNYWNNKGEKLTFDNPYLNKLYVTGYRKIK